MIIAKTQNITKKYGEQLALNNVSITIENGDVYGLVGQNGAGKTTLIKLLAGLAYQTDGEIQIFPESGESLNDGRKKIGCVIESPAFFKNLTAEQNLHYYWLQYGLKDKEVIRQSLETAGIADTGKKKFGNFSLGMKQRLGIALAMLTNPDFLILDEPINGLDPTGIAEIRDTLLTLAKRGKTILISSHILSELELIATKFGVIHKGKLIAEMTANEVKERCHGGFKVKVDNLPKAEEILQGMGINDYSLLDGELLLTVTGAKFRPEDILRKFGADGVLVYSAGDYSKSFEDLYFDMINSADK